MAAFALATLPSPLTLTVLLLPLPESVRALTPDVLFFLPPSFRTFDADFAALSLVFVFTAMFVSSTRFWLQAVREGKPRGDQTVQLDRRGRRHSDAPTLMPGTRRIGANELPLVVSDDAPIRAGGR